MANFNLNKIMLGGRLTADPELRTTPSGKSVTSISIAVNRKNAKENDAEKADFFNCTAFGKTAEFITRFFRKASCICVMGELRNKSWVDGQGIKRSGTEVIIDEAFFVDAKGGKDAANMGYAPGGGYADSAGRYDAELQY